MTNPDDYLDQRDVELAALAEENRRLREVISSIESEIESEMSRAEHRKKIAEMDYHDSEVNHQEGRWHCAYDLLKFTQQALKGTEHAERCTDKA